LGGTREVALATYLAARLAHDTLPERGVSQATRNERAQYARTWLSSTTLPQTVRPALSRLVDATGADAVDASDALIGVIAATVEFLDAGARSELEQLATVLGARPGEG
jgi:hypothetical protein